MYHIALQQAVDFHQAGGKAANLARSAPFGFQIPEGFVLLRAAMQVFLEQNQFSATARAAFDAYEKMAWQERIAQYEALCAAASQLMIPSEVRDEIEPSFHQMLKRSSTGLAVRSSGVCEDLEKASFAGIYETFLGVKDLTTFWQHVIHCWCSLWSPQSAAYAKKMGIEIPMDGMAVLVQTMIPAESAGVAFTADPLTGDPWHFVLNATFGLAAKLVDGTAPADRFVLAWDSGAILEQRIVQKPDALFYFEDRIQQVALPEQKQKAASLTEEQAQQVGKLALNVDRAFDRRMDLEWAFAGGQLYLLQARPLTALPPFFPHELAPEEAEETWKLLQDGYGKLNEHERLVAPFHRDYSLLEMWNRYRTPDDIFPHPIARERDFNGYRYATEWQWVKAPYGCASHEWLRIEQWLDQNENRLRQEWLTQLERVRQSNTWMDEEIASAMDRPTTRAVDWVRLDLAYRPVEKEIHAAGWYASQWMAGFCEELLKLFYAEVMPESGIPDLPAVLLQGLSCRSIERAIDAQVLGQAVREPFVREAFTHQPLSQVIPFLSQRYPDCTFLRAFARFCDQYGHEFPSPDGQQDPYDPDLGGVLLLIKHSILGQGEDAKMVLQKGIQKRQTAETRVRDWLRNNRPDQLDRFNKLLYWAQFWTPALDNRGWHGTTVVRLRRVNRKVREALVSEGMIDQQDHFFLLTSQDWADYAAHPDAKEVRALYLERKREYERNRRLEPALYLGKQPEQNVPPPPHREDREKETTHPAAKSKRIFRGEGIAPGTVRGLAYQVESLSNQDYLNHLSTEHILICGRDEENAQWRRDWGSIFMIARGLVTVAGAQLHHAAMIAREYGIPFINLLGENIADLPNGTLIEIDGQTGTLTIL